MVPQSPVNSETSSQCSNGTPCSKKAICSKKRTPQLFKKPKTKDFGATDDLETLQDKIVEITNKDMFINELIEQQEEFKQSISDMKNNFYEKEKNLREKHDLELKELVNKNDKELNELYNRILEMDMQIKSVRTEYNELKAKNEADLVEISKNINEFNDVSKAFKEELKMKSNEVRNKTDDLNQLKIAYDELKTANAAKIDEINQKHKTEMEEMQFEMLKTIAEMQKQTEETKKVFKDKLKHFETSKNEEIQKLKEKFEGEKEKMKNESEMQVKQMKEDFREAEILSEMQFNEKLKEIEVGWKIKLEDQEKQSDQILKECQAISEYNIIQSEVEKNQIKSELTKKSKELEEIISEKKEFEKQQTELKNKLEDFKNQAENISKILEEKSKEIENIEEKNKLEIEKKTANERAYQITISKLHETIEALKKRLINSDRDVEQLKNELEICETSKLESEDRFNKLKDELKTMQNNCEELELHHEYSLKLMEDNIKKAERILHQKVDDYKTSAERIEADLREQLEEKEKLLGDAMEQLAEQQKLIGESQKLFKNTKMEMERIEAENIDFEYKNKCLEMAEKRMERELENVKKRNAELEETLEKIDLENLELKKEMKNTKVSSEEIENFTKQITILQEKSDSYYHYCEYYKNKCAENESELDELIELRKKYIEQSGKQDELHQKCETLEKENTEMKARIAQQELLIGPFREQLQAYEMEHRALLSEKRDAEAEAREMGLKYASILGHQNTKQKIKYLVDLQEKKFELIEVS